MRPLMPWSKTKTKAKSLSATLTLTSLVDGFSLLLIYLILAASGDTPIEVTPGVDLPEVRTAQLLSDSPVITVRKNQYLFNNQNLNLAQLRAQLVHKKSMFKGQKAIIEADRETPYSSIEPLMVMISELNIESIQLAVNAEESQ